MKSSHDRPSKYEPDSCSSTRKESLIGRPAVVATSRPSSFNGPPASRGQANLALIFQPGYTPIHRGVMSKLSSRDLTRLREAASQDLSFLRSLNSPYLPQPQVHCQNIPPLPMIWKDRRGTNCHGWVEQMGPRQPCRRELQTENVGVDLAVCEGYRLGLRTGLEHGEDFLVCKHCVALGKSQLRMLWPGNSVKPVGDARATAELCADCALDRQLLRPGAMCQCESRFENLNLCWDCRVDYPKEWLLDVICEAAAFLPVMDTSVPSTGNMWLTLERWILPPTFEPRSGCLDCGIDYIQSGQSWFDLWTASERSGGEDCLPCLITPQSETVCLYCLLPVSEDRCPRVPTT